MRHAREREREVSAYRPPYRAERSRNTQSWWLGVGFSAPGVARERCVFVGRLVFRLHSIKENLLQAHVPCTPILRAVWVSRRILGGRCSPRHPAPGAGGSGRALLVVVGWWWGGGVVGCGVRSVWCAGVWAVGGRGGVVAGAACGVGWWEVGGVVGAWQVVGWWGGGHVVCEASTRRRAPSLCSLMTGPHVLYLFWCENISAGHRVSHQAGHVH